MSSTTPKTCVIIPAYHEEAHIGDVVREVRDYCADVIVVDDGSSDHTAQEATAAGATVLTHIQNQGKGAALQTGFDYARENGYELAITMDADGQHAPSDIPAFLQAYARTGSVALVGNRMDHPAGMPGLRRFVNRFMSALLSRLIRQHVPVTRAASAYTTAPPSPRKPMTGHPAASPPNPKSCCASPSPGTKSAR